MEKTKYNKWNGKYINCKIIDFTLDMKGYKRGDVGLKHKNVLFASLTKQEYNVFDTWTKKEQINFLSGYWNYYVGMMA